MAPHNYGNYYFCIKVSEEVSKDGEIYVHADRIEFRDGALLFWGRTYPDKSLDEKDPTNRWSDYDNPDSEEELNLILNKDQWKICFRASVLDGAALAVQYWSGEVAERR